MAESVVTSTVITAECPALLTSQTASTGSRAGRLLYQSTGHASNWVTTKRMAIKKTRIASKGR